VTDAAVTNGFSSGIASSAKFNKALRQGTFVASGLATWIAQQISGNVPDDGNLANFVTSLSSALSDYVATLGYAPTTGFANSLGSSGYQKLPSGLIIQWGNTSVSSGSNNTTTSVSFPLAFPTACFSVTATQTTSANRPNWSPLVLGALSRTTTGFSLLADTANPSVSIASGVTADWMALGN
jgi:hypothetical protein